VETTRSGVVGLAASVWTLAAAFFLGFSVACLGAAVGLGLGFRRGRHPGGGHFRLLGRLRDWLGKGFWIWGWIVVVLTTRPLGRRDSTPRPGPSAGQRARPAKLSEREGGLWQQPFGQARALLCKSRPRFFPLNITPIVRRVVYPATTALRLFPRVRASTG